MTRDAFLNRLRGGLKGMSPSAVADVMADYESHFAEGEGAGRSEAEIAQALGDPDRLARELRAEAGLRRWEEERNPTAAVGAVFAVLGLATIDLLILLPILVAVGGTLFGLSIASIAIFFAGGFTFVTSMFQGSGGAGFAGLFAGLGLMSGAVASGALLILGATMLVNVLVRYARLHFRLLKPALQA